MLQFTSKNESKAAGELFFAWYSFAWIGAMALVVVTEVYLDWSDWEFLTFGLALWAPCWLCPYLFPSDADQRLPLTSQYWFKANVWVAVFGFIGNYFWTHYFYVVLGATYSFPVTWTLNGVPIFLYLLTHPYFLTYHTLANQALRGLRTSPWYRRRQTTWSARLFVNAAVVCLVAYVLAFMEAWSIERVPYYNHRDRWQMYTVGSTFYSLYFVVSFPMYFRLDESKRDNWSVGRTVHDVLAAGMAVFLLCDWWRLLVGPLGLPSSEGSADGVPFLK